MVDILIKNGKILDGSGSKATAGDVAIENEKIVDVGMLQNVKADVVIDATGKIVSPGFIDMHSHHDAFLPLGPEADALVFQGITTAVTGQCGLSPAPLADETREEVIQATSAGVPLPFDQWSSFGSFLDFVEKIGTSVNIAPLAGQGLIRSAVMGFSAARPSEEQIQKMVEITEQCMEEGAIGISTGLIYPPGSYASTEELIEITKPVGKKGGFYFSHVRGEGDTLLDAIQEEIEIGRKTGAILHHSHYKAAGKENWDKALPGLQMIDQANASGVDMSVDMYPYTAGGTSLTAILPEWAQEGGLETMLKRLSDSETRAKMTESMKREGFFKVAEWDKVLIADSTNPAYVGKYIAELAQIAGKTPYNWIFDAVYETKGETGMILFMMAEENIKKQLAYPKMMIGDGCRRNAI